jgi:hypothetical protein
LLFGKLNNLLAFSFINSYLILQVRHTTANMQFDAYASTHLSGGVERDAAFLAGHDATTQLSWYTDHYKKIALCGFRKLAQLADEEQSHNEDVVKQAGKSVRLLKK